MIHYLLVFLAVLPMVLGYGVMVGFTARLSYRAGLGEAWPSLLGAFWPLGLGIAVTYGATHGLSRTVEERQAARTVTIQEQRAEELAQAQHSFKLAQLRANEDRLVSERLKLALTAQEDAKEVQEIEAPSDVEDDDGWRKEGPSRQKGPAFDGHLVDGRWYSDGR